MKTEKGQSGERKVASFRTPRRWEGMEYRAERTPDSRGQLLCVSEGRRGG